MVGLVQHVFSNTVSNATGTITIWNVSGVQQTIAATNVVRPQDWNSTHNMSVTLTGNTAFGNTSVVGGTNIIFRASGGLMFSGNSAGSSIGLGLAQVASGSLFPGGSAQGQGSYQTLSPTTSSLYLYPWYPVPDVTWVSVALPISLASSQSTGATSNSGGYTITFGLYSVSSTALSSMTTVTAGIKYSYTSNSITYSVSAGASSFTRTGIANQSLFNGAISWYIPMSTSVSGGGSYFIGYVMSAQGQTQTSGTGSAGFQMQLYGAALTGATWGRFDSSTVVAGSISNSDRFSPVVYNTGTLGFPASIPYGTTNSALNYVSNFAFFQVVNSV